MRRLDFWMLAATVVVGVCAYLAQRSTAQALAHSAFLTRQVMWLGVGLALVGVVAFADYRILTRLSPVFYAATIGLLLLLFVAGPLRASAQRWLALGSYTLQPSEFARVATILAVAALAGRHRSDRLTVAMAARVTAVVVAPMLLIVLQPDLGSALTFAPILLATLWLGGLRARAWLALVTGGLVLCLTAWFWYLKPYQKERLLTFADPSRAPYSTGYQQRQSKIAVGSGEFAGKGLRAGTQSQLRFLPAQHTDFIFAVWAEETGFVGSCVLIAAYATLILRIFVVAIHARDRVGALVAGCVGAVMLAQVAVNVAMVTGIAPTTGITLPLLSYGGSSVLATGIALGLVQSVWRLRFANV